MNISMHFVYKTVIVVSIKHYVDIENRWGPSKKIDIRDSNGFYIVVLVLSFCSRDVVVPIEIRYLVYVLCFGISP